MGLASKASLWTWGGIQTAKLGRPDVALGFLGGIGDDLLCTAPIHEMLDRGVGRIWFFTRHPELYSHFDRRVRLIPEDPRYTVLAARLGRPFRPLSYSEYDAATDRDTAPGEHLIAMMCRRAGLTGRVQLKPHLVLSDAELGRANRYAGTIAVQSGGLVASLPMRNKQWKHDRFQSVVDQLAQRGHQCVQVGSASDPALRGVIDCRGRLALRQTAALLARVRLFVGTVGFLMHLARAVECPSAIVYGGRERADLTGYSCNANVAENPPCSPCWQRNACAHGHECMDAISTERVLAAADSLLARPRNPLPVDDAWLS